VSTPTVRPRRRLLRWLGEASLILVVAAALQFWATRDAVEGAAPPLEGAWVNAPPAGGEGRASLVHFWATWCPSCRLEHGTIQRLAHEHPVVTVAMQSGDAADVAAYLQERGLSFPVRLDEHGEGAARWGVRGVPTTFVVDRDGQIRFVTTGFTTDVGLRLRLWLAGRT
jgi:thiol-disulfide isomerase/thioredoxin